MSKPKLSNMSKNQEILDNVLENLDSDSPAIRKAVAVSKVMAVKFRGYKDQMSYQSLDGEGMNIPFYKE